MRKGSEGWEAFLAKAQESLKVAQWALENGFYNECASRSYYAVLRAAVAALLTVGLELPSGKRMHEWVQANFVFHCIDRRKLYPAHFGGYILRLMHLREQADYEPEPIKPDDARRALRRAEEFVQAVRKRVMSL